MPKPLLDALRRLAVLRGYVPPDLILAAYDKRTRRPWFWVVK